MNTIKVTISGPAKSGKTTIAQIIKDALGDMVEVEDKDCDLYSYPTSLKVDALKHNKPQIKVEMHNVNRAISEHRAWPYCD
jgi:uridine kinase